MAISTVSADYDLKTCYFYIPLGLKLYTGELLPCTRFYAQGTVACGFLTSATNYSKETHSVNNGKSTYKYSKHVDLLDMEIPAGLGAEMRLADKLNGFASARYSYGANSAQGTPLDFVVYNDFYGKSGAYPLLNVEVGLKYVPYRRVPKPAPAPQPQAAPIRSAYQAPATSLLAAQ